MTKTKTRGPAPLTFSLGSLAKPSALRHCKRRENSKYDKPDFDPREARHWLTKDGRFTLPAITPARKR